MDAIFNGQAFGNVAKRLLESGGDPGVLKPYIAEDGQCYITRNADGPNPVIQPVFNTDATLRKNEWQELDVAVVKAAQNRLRVVSDLNGAGLSYNIPNGLGKTVFQSERQSDINAATISMDGLRQGDNDRPVYDILNLPLPIIHKDFHFSLRQLMTSRNGSTPLDTSMAELAARKCAEQLEDMVIGNLATYTYGGGSIYGMITSPYAIPVTLDNPATLTGWTGANFLADVLEMKEASQLQYHYGPWMLYTGVSWDKYLDSDFSTLKGDLTLRQRIKMIEGIQDVRTLDRLAGYTCVLVQMTTDVIRMVNGMGFTTIQWETDGGMKLNFKVMGIAVPQIREDYNGNTGIVLGTV